MAENSEPNQKGKEEHPPIRSTRHDALDVESYDPRRPRLGRRESEPHSAEISYLYEVLHTNFPKSRTTWDLHHYFHVGAEELDIQFDISFFKEFTINYELSSYRAAKFNNRVPTMAINVLSKSTWQKDVGIHVDYCRLVKIPLYIVFCPNQIGSAIYKPPFLRAYMLRSNGDYHVQDMTEVAFREGDASINRKAVLDVGKTVPFNLGLMILGSQFEEGLPRYRMILVHPESHTILPTRAQKAEARADQAEARADQAEARADQAEARAERLQEELARYKNKT